MLAEVFCMQNHRAVLCTEGANPWCALSSGHPWREKGTVPKAV